MRVRHRVLEAALGLVVAWVGCAGDADDGAASHDATSSAADDTTGTNGPTSSASADTTYTTDEATSTTTSTSTSTTSTSTTSTSGTTTDATGTTSTMPNEACIAGCMVEVMCGTEWSTEDECVQWCEANLVEAAMFTTFCRDAWENLHACIGTLDCAGYDDYLMGGDSCYEAYFLQQFECEGQ